MFSSDKYACLVHRSRWGEFVQRRDGATGEEESTKSAHIDTKEQAEPRWVQAVQSFDDIEKATKRRLDVLVDLQRHHLMPHFTSQHEDDEVDTAAIVVATQDVQRLLKELERLITHGMVAREASNDEECRIVFNARRCLSGRLRHLTSLFRRTEESFMNALRRRDVTQRHFKCVGDTATRALLRQEEKVARFMEMGFADEADIASLLQDDAQREATEAEVESVVQSLQEVHGLFSDMSAMVDEQGTMLDRVDHNIQQATVAVAHAKAQLVQASQHHSTCSVA